MKLLGKVLYRYLLLIWILHTIGCASPFCIQTIEIPLQILQTSDLVRTHYPEGLQGDWLYALELSHSFFSKGESCLKKSIHILYSILKNSKANSILLSLFSHSEIQEKIIERAIFREVFTSLTLNKKQLKDVERCCRFLNQASQYFLYSGVILAELRQKCMCWKDFPYFPKTEPYPNLAFSLQELPTLKFLEIQQKKIKTLLEACLQLQVSNPDIDYFL